MQTQISQLKWKLREEKELALADARQEAEDEKASAVASAKAIAAEDAVERYNIARVAAAADKAEALWRGEDKGTARVQPAPPRNGPPGMYGNRPPSVHHEEDEFEDEAGHHQHAPPPKWHGVHERVDKGPSPRQKQVGDARASASAFSRVGMKPKQKPDPVSATPRLPPVSPREYFGHEAPPHDSLPPEK